MKPTKTILLGVVFTCVMVSPSAAFGPSLTSLCTKKRTCYRLPGDATNEPIIAKKSSMETAVALFPRGGASAALSSTATAGTLAQVMGGLVLMEGIASVFFSRLAARLLSKVLPSSSVQAPPDGSIRKFLLEGGVGAGDMVVGTATVLSTFFSNNLPTSKIVAYSIMAMQLVYAKVWYASNIADKLGGKKTATNVGFGVATAAILMLLFGNSGDGILQAGKTWSIGLSVWTLGHYFFPGILKKTFGMDIEEEGPETLVLYKGGCASFLGMTTLLGCLCYGMSFPVAMGYTSLLYAVTSLDILIFHNGAGRLGLSGVSKLLAWIFYPIFTGAVAAGILL